MPRYLKALQAYITHVILNKRILQMSVLYIPITKELFNITERLLNAHVFSSLAELLESGNRVREELKAQGSAEGFQQYRGFIEVCREHLENASSNGLELSMYNYQWYPVDLPEGNVVDCPGLLGHPVWHAVGDDTMAIPTYGLKAKVKPMSVGEMVDLFRIGVRVADLTESAVPQTSDVEQDDESTLRERFIDSLRIKSRNKPYASMPDLTVDLNGSFKDPKTRAMYNGYRMFADEQFVLHKKKGDKVYPLGKYIIASLDAQGRPHFSRSPYRHATYYGAKFEADRLSQALNKRFAVFRCTDIIHPQESNS